MVNELFRDIQETDEGNKASAMKGLNSSRILQSSNHHLMAQLKEMSHLTFLLSRTELQMRSTWRYFYIGPLFVFWCHLVFAQPLQRGLLTHHISSLGAQLKAVPLNI